MTANQAFVRVTPECALANGPWDTNPTWYVLAAYHRDDSPFKISRGRSNDFSKFEPGKLNGLILDNRSRVFDPNYTAAPAPFAGNMQPSKQFRIMGEYPWLPGMLPAEGSRNTGWTVGGSGGPTTYDQVGSTYDSAGSVYDAAANVTLALSSGDAPWAVTPQQALKVTVTAGTTGGIFSPVLACKSGQTVTATIRSKMTSANAGATAQTQQIVINFYQASGAVSAITPQSPVGSTSTPKRTWGDGVWDGPATTTVVVPSDAVTMQIEVTATVYQTNDTVYFDAVVIDYAAQYINKPISVTFVDDWKIKWKGRDSTCTVSASDAFAAFSVKDLENLGWENQIANTPNLRHYWTLGERGDWTAGYTQEYAPSTARLLVKYFAGWGVPGPILTDLTTGVGLTADSTMTIAGWFDARNMLNPVSGAGWSIGFWCQMAGTTNRLLDFGQNTDPNSSNSFGQYGITLYTLADPVNDPSGVPQSMKFAAISWPSSTANLISCWFKPPPNVVDPRVPAYTTTGSFYDGAYHFVVITLATDNQTFSFYVDGQQVTPAIAGGSGSGSGNASGQNVIATGPITFPAAADALVGAVQGAPGWTGQLAHLFVVDRAMTGSEISTLYNMGQAQWFGQSPQSRVNAILDTINFPSGQRDLDVGSSTLGAETSNLSQTNALQYLQYVEDSEAGWCFTDQTGFVNFIGRLTMVKASGPDGTTPQYVLGDLWPTNPSVEIPMLEDPELDNSNTLIYTEAEGSMGTGARASGTARKTSGNLYAYADNTSLVTQGKRTISKTNMLNSTEAEVSYMLQYLVAQYKTPKQRLVKIKVMPIGVDEAWLFCLNIEIGMAIQVNLRPPPGGTNVTNLLGRVQKIEHTIGRKSWETEIIVAQVDVSTYLNLDNATLGKLDSGNKLFF